jgi:integrase
MRLSERNVARWLKSVAGREAMMTSADVPSLSAQAFKSGVGSWNYRRRANGRVYKITIGRIGIVSSVDAHNIARVYDGRIAQGFNPIGEKRAEAERYRAEIEAQRQAKIEAVSASVFTLGVMFDGWAASRENDRRSVRYVTDTKSTLERTFAPVLDLPARDFRGDRIRELLSAANKTRGPDAAGRAQGALDLAFKHAIKIGKLEVNPLAQFERPKAKERERVLAASECQRLFRAAGTLSLPKGNFVRGLLLTGVRVNELLRARWSWVEGGRLNIPANAMKGGRRPFSVPMTPAFFRCLPARGTSDFIFARAESANPIGGLSRLKTELDAAVEADGSGPLADWRFHDIRRGIASWLADHGVDYVIADLILAHLPPLSRVGLTYQRSFKLEERRRALEMWAGMLDPDSMESAAPTLRLVAP